jgi:hypothetical protein
MKFLTYCSLFVLVTLLSLPVTADAFGRRSHSSEVFPTQQTTQLTNTTETGNPSAQAVPEPPVYLLMSVGIGILGLYTIAKRFRRSSR